VSENPGPRPPKQARSRETLGRLLDAAEDLLEQRAWDEITISDIVTRAGSSVGSFYARFPSKDDLLAELLERYHDDTRSALSEILGAESWAELCLEARVHHVTSRVVDTCRRRRGLLRLRHQRRLAGAGREAALEPDRDRRTVRGLAALFEGCEDEIRRPEPEQALLFALRTIDAVVAAAVAFDEISDSFGPLEAATLEREVADMVLAYLRAPGSG
jgi:AcrR family transcriptional regulator